jgi:acetate kinase
MILTINGGSSSIKFSLYKTAIQPEKVYSGQVIRIGLPGMTFTAGAGDQHQDCKASDYTSAITCITGWLQKNIENGDITAIAHRVVHGMQHTDPCLITPELLADLKKLINYDPDHLPAEIELMEAFHKHYPDTPQYACFDTAFHQTMPRVAKLLPIPRRFDRMGIQRYGFHGLSYQYLTRQLEKLAGKEASMGRVVMAHLGNGASLAAVYQGKSIDTSMGFTPAGGIPMSSRSGDLDPGVAWIMMKTDGLSPKQFNHVVNHDCGLQGVSESSPDMSDLLKNEDKDERAADAVAMFCYQVKKWIGGFAAALGGIDTLVFSGGIGENAPVIRKRICEGLDFLGITVDDVQNNENAGLISKKDGIVAVRVIPTNEELMMAEIVKELIDTKP